MSEEKMPLRRSFNVGRMLASYARNLGCEFVINGDPQPPAVIFSEHAFLPAVALHADMEFRSLIGRDGGTVFKSSEESLFGTAVFVDDLTPDALSVFRGLIYMEAARRVFGLEQGRRIECRPIFETFSVGLANAAAQQAAPAQAGQRGAQVERHDG
jgi:hypothetical protein